MKNGKIRVKKIFIATQKLILTSYFDNAINLTYSPKSLDNYRNKLYSFKNVLGYIEYDNFYNEYYIDKMMELEKRYNLSPDNFEENVSLAISKPSFFSRFIRKFKLLLKINKEFEEVS
ncbi:MAG: hypothetical protein HFJ50_00460 [Clostridia bacterium]|nr:hypothetical protein [Clostridia bacterium]